MYLLPIGLWLLVMFLVGWQVAWSTAIPEGGDAPAWTLTLFLSMFWIFGTYFFLIAERKEILEFFGIDNFYY